MGWPVNMRSFQRLIGSLWFFALMALGVSSASALSEADTDAPALKRLAIVIGNSDYQSTRYADLANASNDASKLSESLRRLNFEVASGINLTQQQFEDMFRRYETSLGSYSSVLIFYAGHGIQLNGENYLLPVDTLDPESVEALTQKAIKLNDVIQRFANRSRPTFIFLDACRNSPLPNGLTGGGNGLAQVEVGENTFIAFATQPGNVTVDGAGDNSPFTNALLQNVELPGLSISDMMIRVRNKTEEATLGQQVPWDQSNLREQFYFTEQQVIDSAELTAMLNRIIENPSKKQELMVQLASADTDLQSAVLMLGKQLPDVVRSVSVPGETPPAADAQGQQVASLRLPESKGVASDLQSLLMLGESSESGTARDKSFDLNHRVQTELARVGCYRSRVDGDWGSGSKRALADYYRRTKQDGLGQEPSVELLSDLFLRSGRVCKQPVAAPKPVKVARTSVRGSDDGDDNNRRVTKSGAKKTKNKSTARARAPAALPPDIGAGIGIGGGIRSLDAAFRVRALTTVKAGRLCLVSGCPSTRRSG